MLNQTTGRHIYNSHLVIYGFCSEQWISFVEDYPDPPPFPPGVISLYGELPTLFSADQFAFGCIWASSLGQTDPRGSTGNVRSKLQVCL